MQGHEFDAALRALRVRGRWLAGLLGVQESTVSRWRAGARPLPISVEIIVGLVRAGRVRPAALWGFRSEQSPRPRRVTPRQPQRKSIWVSGRPAVVNPHAWQATDDDA